MSFLVEVERTKYAINAKIYSKIIMSLTHWFVRYFGLNQFNIGTKYFAESHRENQNRVTVEWGTIEFYIVAQELASPCGCSS